MEKAYTRTYWVDEIAPLIDADNLNNIESGIDTLDDRVVAMEPKLTQAYNNAGIAMNGMNVIQSFYAKKTEVAESLAELEAEVSGTYATKKEVDAVTESVEELEKNIADTYATKEELEGISETVSEVAAEVSKGKADVILVNASGESIHVEDSTDNKVVAFALHGKATQNGTPTPDARVDIEVSGADGSVEVKSLGKNHLPYPYTETSHTDNGITWTDLGNGRVMANGTTSVYTDFLFKFRQQGIKLQTGTYKLSGCPKNGSSTSYFIGVNTSENPSRIATDIGNGTEFKIEKETMVGVYIGIEAGTTINNLIFEPMISLEGGEYEPYKESTTNISTPNGLAGIPVSSGGNYVDEKGQRWVTNEKRKYADGTGKKIQRIGKATYNTSSYWGLGNVTDTYTIVACTKPTNMDETITNNEYKVMCNMFTNKSTVGGVAVGGALNFFVPSTYGIKSVDDWKALLGDKTLEFHYVLAEPIITDLTVEELAELEAVQTFYPTTNIINDSNCGMEVTYLADTKNYIDKIIGARLSALESALINNI